MAGFWPRSNTGGFLLKSDETTSGRGLQVPALLTYPMRRVPRSESALSDPKAGSQNLAHRFCIYFKPAGCKAQELLTTGALLL